MTIKYLYRKRNAKSICKIVTNISLFDKINKIEYNSDIETYNGMKSVNIVEIFGLDIGSFIEKKKR